ncbi:hypothetical protein [Nocardioides sp. GXQ0305]|uniref:hypothetical protein n=1 Tax=Nocardioides sp. GXQ0305 TaxID=3423912 RepID=UPI003D7D783F
MSEIPSRPERPRASPWPFAGMVGMACVFFLIAASVLTTPWWVVGGLLVVWGLGLFVATAWWSLHPTWVPWVPVAVAVLWFALVAGGAAAFGWGA